LNKRLQNVFEFFENVLPKYYGSKEIRNSQVQMAIDIAAVLSTRSDHKTIMADAPVGTGKTFAVLIPSIYNQNNNINTSQIIYSTSSLNLQGCNRMSRQYCPKCSVLPLQIRHWWPGFR